jgi:hypothetical protein
MTIGDIVVLVLVLLNVGWVVVAAVRSRRGSRESASTEGHRSHEQAS